jgi:methylated-DNA-[protein]-cysteine S-methyltransferase
MTNLPRLPHLPSFAFAPLATPIGRLLLVSRSAGHLSGIYLENHARAPLQDSAWVQDEARFTEARRQVGEYFAGARTSFDLPLSFEGTPFQRRVWSALLEIPFGETITYAELAQRVGAPKASRAVGGANARNPISIVVPCHRVIGSDGSLTGYAGGEERKRWLLDFERGIGVCRGRRPRPRTRPAEALGA